MIAVTAPVFCFLWMDLLEQCGLGVPCPGVDGDSVTHSCCSGSSAGMALGEL